MKEFHVNFNCIDKTLCSNVELHVSSQWYKKKLKIRKKFKV